MDWMIVFCESLRVLTIKIISFKKKRMKLLTNNRNVKIQKSAIFVKRILKINVLKIIVIIQVNIEVLHIAYVIWNIVCKKIPIVFHNGSN